MLELTTIENKKPEEIFIGDALENLLKEIETDGRAFKPDMSSKAGREAIASEAYKVARFKSTLDKKGTELTEIWRKNTDEVNTQRKTIKTRLESLQVEIRKPLTDWETAEETRVNELKKRLEDLSACGNFPLTPTKDAVSAELIKANGLYQFNWQEFQSQADHKYETIKNFLDSKLAERIKYDAEQEELERLRAEAAARAKKDHEEKIAREAAEKARLDAEAKAAADAERQKLEAERLAKEVAEKAERERQKLEDERNAAEVARVKAEQEKEAAAKKAEEDKKLALEQAETLRKQQEAEKQQAEERAKKAEDELAAANERTRVEAVERGRKAYASYSGVIKEWAVAYKITLTEEMIMDLISRMMSSANNQKRAA